MTRTNYILVILYTLLICSTGVCQMPVTNVYILDLKANEQKVLLYNPKLLTAFNIDGYNNQPHFINDQELLITSNFKSLGLTDILLLHLDHSEISRITATEESEYSPTMMASGMDFSLIRQELDDSEQVPQVLWSYPLDRSEGGHQIIPDLVNIGYHAWVTHDKVALYLVGERSELLVYDTKNKTSTHIAYDVGRCLKVDRLNRLYYTQDVAGRNTIRRYDIYVGSSKHITEALDNQRDFDILPNGHLISAKGSQLFTYIPNSSANWSLVTDLSGAGINHISRIASSRGRLALVTASPR